MHQVIVYCLFCLPVLLFSAQGKWEHLLDMELSNFEVWMGIPHETVEDLPEGTYQSNNVHKGTPMGLDADVKNVFSVVEEDGELILKVTGEIYGGLTTLEEFENYHMSIQVRWGEKKWAPRLNALRDSGILYHCYGEHGSFWQVWKSSLEFQVQESDMGDFISLAGPSANVRISRIEGVKRPRFDKEGEEYGGGYVSAYPEADAQHGEWNQLDLYVIGNYAIHVANGEVVMVVENAKDHQGEPLTKGQIQLQSEAAEVYYKNFKIRSIETFPSEYRDQVRFREE